MSDRLTALRLFVRVARRGSFSAAARELAIPQPTVSRMIAGLERELDAKLLTRTTRAVALTDAGRDYLERVESILAALDDAEQVVRRTGELRGVLRIGTSSSFAVRELVPRLPAFSDRHPALRIELILDDARQDLVTEGVDVALRFGELGDSSATARRVGRWPRVVVASPRYLARAGTPRSPADLARHAIVLGPPRGARSWAFARDGKASSIRVEPRIVATTNEVAVAAAVAGLGVAALTIGGCGRELADGSLVRLLADWDLGTIELHAVFTGGRTTKPAAKAFVAFLIDELERRPLRFR